MNRFRLVFIVVLACPSNLRADLVSYSFAATVETVRRREQIPPPFETVQESDPVEFVFTVSEDLLEIGERAPVVQFEARIGGNVATTDDGFVAISDSPPSYRDGFSAVGSFDGWNIGFTLHGSTNNAVTPDDAIAAVSLSDFGLGDFSLFNSVIQEPVITGSDVLRVVVPEPLSPYPPSIMFVLLLTGLQLVRAKREITNENLTSRRH